MERFKIARSLRRERKAQGLTVRQVAERLNWSVDVVYACENGWKTAASSVVEYARFLHMDTEGMEERWNA